jgi:hypothetical protein
VRIRWVVVDWIHLAQDRDQSQALVNTVMNLQVAALVNIVVNLLIPCKMEDLFTRLFLFIFQGGLCSKDFVKLQV